MKRSNRLESHSEDLQLSRQLVTPAEQLPAHKWSEILVIVGPEMCAGEVIETLKALIRRIEREGLAVVLNGMNA